MLRGRANEQQTMLRHLSPVRCPGLSCPVRQLKTVDILQTVTRSDASDSDGDGDCDVAAYKLSNVRLPKIMLSSAAVAKKSAARQSIQRGE